MSLRIPLLALLGLLSAAASAAEGARTRLVFQGGGPLHIGLFVADADGNNEKPFIPSTASDYNPSYSADGQWIVFTSHRAGSADVWRVRSDGTGLEQLTDDPAFDDQGVLSPDGRRLAFVSSRRGGTANLWVMDVATRKAINLTRNRNGNFRPSWSPDGQWIAFTSDRDMPHKRSGPDAPPPKGSGCCGWELVQSTALYVMRADGSALRRLTAVDGFAGSPEWSPDGQRIAYYDERGQIVAIDVHSGEKTDLTQGPGRRWSPQFVDANTVRYLAASGRQMVLADSNGTQGPPRDAWSPSWSPDGKRVVYAYGTFAFNPGPGPIEKVALDDPQFEFYRAAATLGWSPDGKQVLLSRPFEGEGKLPIVNADGSGRRILYDTGDPEASLVYPAWSPDGQSIVFTLGNYGKRNPVRPSQLILMRADGTQLRTLTQGENGSGYPSFSPDGKRLVFRVLGKEQGLRILTLETGEVRTLTSEVDNFPAWSPRGDRILFTSLRTGDFEMYTIRPDGTGLKQLTRDKGNDAHGSWSPDGKRIVFTATDSGWKDETRLPSNDIQSNGELVVMDADGRNRRQLTDDQWEQAVTAWLPAAY